MLNIDITYNKNIQIYNICAIRIKPKHNSIKNGELCTYSIFLLNEKEKLIDLNIKVLKEYGNAIELTKIILEEFLNKIKKDQNEYILFENNRRTNREKIICEITINREIKIKELEIDLKKNQLLIQSIINSIEEIIT